MPYHHWDANILVVVVTLLAVGLVVLVHYEGLSILSTSLAKPSERRSRRKVLYGIYVVLALHVVEIWIFGLSAWLLLKYPEAGTVAGAHPVNLFDCVYLSAVTYTTVGFGDVAPVGAIRFLAGTVALTGFVMITWSASFTYLEMTKFWRR
jgi:hypothetical protein